MSTLPGGGPQPPGVSPRARSQAVKIRHPALIRAAAAAGAAALRLWARTLRFRYAPLGPDLDPRRPGFRDRYIYAFWHENMLLPAHLYGGTGASVLVSRHADGELIAGVLQRLGFR